MCLFHENSLQRSNARSRIVAEVAGLNAIASIAPTIAAVSWGDLRNPGSQSPPGSRGVGTYDRTTRLHRFQNREPKPLIEGKIQEAVRMVIERRQVRIVGKPSENHTVATATFREIVFEFVILPAPQPAANEHVRFAWVLPTEC